MQPPTEQKENYADDRINLSTYQRRVRRLSGLLIRNFTFRATESNPVIWFSLHKDEKSPEFYRSEELPWMLHPIWESIDLSSIPLQCATQTHLLVCIWIKEREDNPKCHVSYAIELSAMELTTFNDIDKIVSRFDNHLHIKMFERFFTAPIIPVPNHSNPSSLHLHASRGNSEIKFQGEQNYQDMGVLEESCESVKSSAEMIEIGKEVDDLSLNDEPEKERNGFVKMFINVPKNTVKNSYSIQQILRLMTAARALKQTLTSTDNAKREIEEKLSQSKQIDHIRQQIEHHESRMSNLTNILQRSQIKRREQRIRLQEKREITKKKEREVEILNRETVEDDSSYSLLISSYNNTRERLLKSNALLLRRQKQLLSDLNFIYPIDVTEDSSYYIGGVNLQQLDDITSSHDDVETSTALGYITHYMILLSRITSLPLPYPLLARGSRSLVHDPHIKASVIKDKKFPLYSRGRDKQFYRYGVFLLNKNIFHLRSQLGLVSKDMSQTLRNLSELVKVRFTISGSHSGYSTVYVSPSTFKNKKSKTATLQKIQSMDRVDSPSLNGQSYDSSDDN